MEDAVFCISEKEWKVLKSELNVPKGRKVYLYADEHGFDSRLHVGDGFQLPEEIQGMPLLAEVVSKSRGRKRREPIDVNETVWRRMCHDYGAARPDEEILQMLREEAAEDYLDGIEIDYEEPEPEPIPAACYGKDHKKSYLREHQANSQKWTRTEK